MLSSAMHLPALHTRACLQWSVCAVCRSIPQPYYLLEFLTSSLKIFYKVIQTSLSNSTIYSIKQYKNNISADHMDELLDTV
jgi:hypothetical protein